MQGLRVQQITANVLAVDAQTAAQADPRVTFRMRAFHLFRRKEGKAYYIGKNPWELNTDDVSAINRECDAREGSLNRDVKNKIARSLRDHFRERAYHIYELGSGKYPIADYLQSPDVTFHAIESDTACLEHLHRMNVPASHWDKALSSGAPDGKPSICVSVYSLHFMVNKDIASSIGALTSRRDGFMVANFYIHPEEARTQAGRTQLARHLREQGMEHIVLRDPQRPNSNEYWIIGRADCREAMHTYRKSLQDTLDRKNAPASPSPMSTAYQA